MHYLYKVSLCFQSKTALQKDLTGQASFLVFISEVAFQAKTVILSERLFVAES